MSQLVSQEVTRKVAKLSRLKLSDAEIERYTAELGKILDFVAELNAVNTDGVEPLVHGFALDAHFREDVALLLPEETTRKIVACAEQNLYDQYKVPQVLGGE